MTEQKKPFMSKWRKDRIRQEHAKNAAARRRTSSGYTSPLTDPANPGAVYYQENHFYPDGSYTSESSSSGYASRSDTDYGSRDSGSSSSYDSGSSGSSYDGGSSSGGGSYGE